MIANTIMMKNIEEKSQLSSLELMEEVGKQIAEKIIDGVSEEAQILILCGCGNNGGDGFAVARYLHDRNVKVALVDGKPKSEEAKMNFEQLDASLFIKESQLYDAIKEADILIDAVYGIGFHGCLKKELKDLFRRINDLDKTVLSIDINSGAEADTASHDSDALHSFVTYALLAEKPFHLLRKHHQLFSQKQLILSEYNHVKDSPYLEMNEDIFFSYFPKKKETDYKGSYGRTLISGGCFGMAGALNLNILGARSVGTPYIDVALPENIYPIVSGIHTTAVYHPFGGHTSEYVLEPLAKIASATLFGSGAVYMDRKEHIMDMVLQNSNGPVVLDAEALRILKNNTFILRFVKCPVIVTPHIAEFAGMANLSTDVINSDRIGYALQFAKEYHVTVVLKGSHTIVASPEGRIYINQSGNQALAQAGSGDLLAGMLVGILTHVHDTFVATAMAVWLHGHLADEGIQHHSIQSFSLEHFPSLADEFFRKNGY